MAFVVWVDAPNKAICGYTSGRCCLNGFFEPNYEWLIFQTGDKKKLANEQLYNEAVARNLNWYKGIELKLTLIKCKR